MTGNDDSEEDVGFWRSDTSLPFLARSFDVVMMIAPHFVWFIFITILSGVVFSLVVGIDDVVMSLNGLFWFLGQGIDLIFSTRDTLFIGLAVVYFFWLLKYREKLAVDRPEYDSTNAYKSIHLLKWTVITSIIGGYTVYLLSVNAAQLKYSLVFAVFVIASWKTSSFLSDTIREDRELRDVRLLKAPWVYCSRIGTAFSFFVLFDWISLVTFTQGVLISMIVPLTGWVYLLFHTVKYHIIGVDTMSGDKHRGLLTKESSDKTMDQSQISLSKNTDDSEWKYE